ncbi:hypothetical protein RBA41_19390 [Massilia sp. CCM 9210]|uniref:hypothetical protein n=1 Tax=Massilia scottii TaxID=3057166 RepID=UPI002796C077|nr:hypothetical protein [Massilia sp. CCM 9210]MDQ1815468.1 hypothetical protein [Massilia sp. CCM 9210]
MLKTTLTKCVLGAAIATAFAMPVTSYAQSGAALKKFEAKAKDPDVKALAAKMLPTVEQHLHSATSLAPAKGGAAHAAAHNTPMAGAKTPAPAAGVKPPVVGEANEQNAGKR